MPLTEIRHSPLPKQIEFLQSNARRLIYSGSWGAGKSRALCFKLVIRACRPKHKEGLARKTLQSLKASTLKTLLEPEGDLPAVLPPGTYSHNKQDHVLNIHGGGEIYYFGVADRQKDGQVLGVGSLNLSGCAIDEWVELEKNETKWVGSRVRLKGKGITRQLYGACNPGGPQHYLAQDFGLSPGNDIKAQHAAIRTCSKDNPHLPQDYLDELDAMTGVDKLRYRDGLWVAAEGIIYTSYLEDFHVLTIPAKAPWQRAILSIDDGYTNPFSMHLLLMDADGRIHVAEEFYQSGLLPPDKRAAVARLEQIAVERYGTYVEAVIVDPSAAGFIAELQLHGHPAVPADNSVIDGIRRVQDRLIVQGDGLPRLTLDPACIKAREEFGMYAWKKNRSSGIAKDEPEKKNDHAMDDIRYGVGYYDLMDSQAVRIHLL